MNKTNISYLNWTWNPTKGCSKVSKGCEHCWAERMSKRLAGNNIRGYDSTSPFKPTFCSWKLQEPLQVRKPSIIGVSFMGDLFHDAITDEQRLQIFEVMRVCPQHTFVLCTKRPENIISFLDNYIVWFSKNSFPFNLLKHIWFGCSIENKQSFDNRLMPMDLLHNHYSLNTWASIEPLLEDISPQITIAKDMNVFDTYIVGGESGSNARYCDPNWIMDILEITKGKVYFKQWGTNKNNCPGTFFESQISTPEYNYLPWKKS